VEVSVLRARSVEVSALGYGARLYVVRPDEALLHLRRGAIEEVKRLSYSLYWGQLSAEPHLGGVEYLVLALIGLATSGAVTFFMVIHNCFNPFMAIMYADAICLSSLCLLIASWCSIEFVVPLGFT